MTCRGTAVDIADQSTDDSAVVQHRTRAEQADQQFQHVGAGSGYHKLRTRHSGKALDV